jgi:hypothetical protein
MRQFFAALAIAASAAGPLASSEVNAAAAVKRGGEVINTFLFLDSNTFTAQAMAESERDRTQSTGGSLSAASRQGSLAACKRQGCITPVSASTA